jgi:hypothetical protein
MTSKSGGKIPNDILARDRYFGAILEDLSRKLSLLIEMMRRDGYLPRDAENKDTTPPNLPLEKGRKLSSPR